MKSTINSLVLIFGLLLLSNAYAETQREQLKLMVEQLQQSPNDNALREKVIKLAANIKPALTIPETAREPFVMGATVLKKASDSSGAGKAIELFTQAINVAPWFADAYYNRAMARESTGQFDLAIEDLKLYLGFQLTDTERREAQDKIYALKADAQLASVKKVEQDKIASVEEAKRQAQQAKRDVITQIKNAVANRNYNSSNLSYSSDSGHMWDGVNQRELFGGGQYYLYGNYDYYIYFWKFLDERVEVWVTSNNGYQHCEVHGESWGPKITDMRWFNGCSDQQQWWGYFDIQSQQLYTGVGGGNNRPISDSEFDPNKRYTYTRYSPPK